MTPYYDRDGITIYCGDCLDVMPRLEPGSFDLLTDPPYGLGEKWTGGTWFTQNVYANDKVNWDTGINQKGVNLAIEICNESIIWGGNYYNLPPSRCWFSWNKNDNMPTMADFELAWTNFDRPSKQFNHSRNGWVRQHPTEKPLALISWCVNQLSGANILDPFLGSGTTLVAAQREGRRAVGIEINEDYCQVAVERLKQPSFWSLPVEPKLAAEQLSFAGAPA